jgi:hypothetical protein
VCGASCCPSFPQQRGKQEARPPCYKHRFQNTDSSRQLQILEACSQSHNSPGLPALLLTSYSCPAWPPLSYQFPWHLPPPKRNHQGGFNGQEWGVLNPNIQLIYLLFPCPGSPKQIRVRDCVWDWLKACRFLLTGLLPGCPPHSPDTCVMSSL